MGNGSSASASESRRREEVMAQRGGMRVRSRLDMDQHDRLSSVGGASPSPARSYYEGRYSGGGSKVSSAPSPPPLSMDTVSMISARINSADEKLRAKREMWKKDTAKRIHVVVRVRPLMMNELRRDAKDIIYMNEEENECTILVPKSAKTLQQNGGNPNKSITFGFDRAYGANQTTAEIYNEIPYSLIQGVLEGYNATVMAYGQTGSGKSFSMQEDPDHIGIIPRAIVHIFEEKEAKEDRDTDFTVQISYVEIYNEEIRDLLSNDQNQKLEIKGNKGDVAGLTIHKCETIGQCAKLLRSGIASRATSATYMNEHSSRSHSVFTMMVTIQYRDRDGVQETTGKLNMVDLAGSERHGKTGISSDEGLAFTESKSINLSLSTLGKVIQALSSEKTTHIPYRESKLTRLLQDSLGGNARTMMIACLSPSDGNFEETLSTLKYAHNTKHINNRPVVNIEKDPKDALIRDLKNEIKSKDQLIKGLQNTRVGR